MLVFVMLVLNLLQFLIMVRYGVEMQQLTTYTEY